MNKETKKRTTQREMMIVISKDTNQRETRTKTKQRPISQMTKSNTRELPRRKRRSHVTTRARFRKTLIVIEWNLLIKYILCLFYLLEITLLSGVSIISIYSFTCASISSSEFSSRIFLSLKICLLVFSWIEYIQIFISYPLINLVHSFTSLSYRVSFVYLSTFLFTPSVI